MPYVPINTASYVASYAGAIAGMATSGWIVDPISADYADATVIAGAFAQAFDTAWNNAAQLNDLELACMTSVVQTDFNGRGPGPFANTQFKDPTNWNVAARACVALILECDIFFASQGITPPTPGTGGSAVSNVLFVDGTLGTAAGTGSIGVPFQTVQQVVTYGAVTLALPEFWVQCAPGVYNGAVSVPNGFPVGICSWGGNIGMPVELNGNITLDGTYTNIAFRDVTCNMATISVTTPATDALAISFQNCSVSAEITAAAIDLTLQTSNLSGDITAGTILNLYTDGYSWASIIDYGVTLLPAGYGRIFIDAGHTTYTTTLNATGVPVFPAVGSTVFVALPIPAISGIRLREGDRAQIQVADSTVQDFSCAVHGTANNSVVVSLTNLSRVSTDFSDEVLLTFHHDVMSSIPDPP